jgi:hypothetical protein
MVQGDLISRAELFDEVDLDAALARFDELSRTTPRLENRATRVMERFQSHLADRDWDAMTEMLAVNASNEDRRRIVNAEIRLGRNSVIEDLQASVGVIGITYNTSFAVATRGDRLVLIRAHLVNSDRPDEVQFDVLQVIELDDEERVAAVVTFDADDIDAALRELDSRYLAGEGAAHAHTWSVITDAYAALNRRELPSATTGFASIDHRRAVAYAPGDLKAYVRAGWELEQDIRTHVEVVHRLNDLGAVVTHAAHGTSQEGFDAEWRWIDILTVEGNLISRSEVFDEADIEAAIARFDELAAAEMQFGNTATRVYECFRVNFEARDWDAIGAMLAEDHYADDRRHVIGAGIWNGRDAEIAGIRATSDLGVTNLTSATIAIRGQHLGLCRVQGVAGGTSGFANEVLRIVEIDADDRIVTRFTFDLEDIDAAFAELEARYISGEAAAHAHTWSVITRGLAALNRHELSLTTANFASIDHRRAAAYAPGELVSYVRAGWELGHDIRTHIEVVHRLNSLGAVVTHAASGTSQEGFDAEWRGIDILTVDGDLISRSEVFDEDDLDAALARFDELAESKPRLVNEATQIGIQLAAAYNRRDPDAYLALVSPDGLFIDRRKGLRSESEASLRQNLRAVLDVSPKSFEMTWQPIATRGSHLSLAHEVWRDHGQVNGPVAVELLTVMEVSDTGLLRVGVAFDPDDLDAAFAELDTRYRDGEAAAHADTWSVVSGAYVTLNRRQIPAATPDCVTVDRRGGGIAHEGNVDSYLNATWDVAPDVTMRIETVHQLTDLGAVLTFTSCGTSQNGFSADWRGINVLTVEGDLISRGEIFDEAGLDAALTRFDEFNQLH